MNDSSIRWWLRQELLLAGLIGLILAVGGWLVPGFAAPKTQLFFSRHAWEFGLLGLGMTLVIISGGIDLSVGSTMGLAAVVMGSLTARGCGIGTAVCGCLATGLACGMINGLMIARLRIHPLIVTLATYATYRGLAEGVSQGHAYTGFPAAFTRLALDVWWGVPVPGWIFAVLLTGLSLGLYGTVWGRSLYVIGTNEQAAHYAGVNVPRIKLWLYSFSGLLAGLAALVYVARFSSAKADIGRGFELDAITAVVVGGASIYGGRGHLVGTVLGLLLIHEMRLLVTRYWQMEELKLILVGGLLIASTLAYHVAVRKGEKKRWVDGNGGSSHAQA